MRKAVFVLIVLSVVFFSCKTKKVLVKEEAKAVVEQTEQQVASTTENVAEDSPIVVKTEEVTVAENEDPSKEGYAYYVVIGSFSNPENASKFKAQLVEKGFKPFMLKSETGFVRVAVDQSNSEKEARSKVMKIRSDFAEHNDVWLLKKK